MQINANTLQINASKYTQIHTNTYKYIQIHKHTCFQLYMRYLPFLLTIRWPHWIGVLGSFCASHFSYLIFTFSQTHNFLLSYLVPSSWGEFEEESCYVHRQTRLKSCLSSSCHTHYTYYTYLLTGFMPYPRLHANTHKVT